MDDCLQYKYKLETHLKYICDENKEYINLYATWELNKKTYKSVLKTVLINYPSYSLHDDSHSEKIITNIEMLLGEDRIKKLSPTDTWMILHCAYLHDFGMALLYTKTEKAFQSDEFKRYIKEQAKSYDKDLFKAVEYIENLKYNLQNEEFESTWPLKVRKYVTEVISDYFRSKHSTLTKEYLEMLSEWNIDISHNNLIQERLVKLIGEISFLHTQDFYKVMELNKESNGHKSDYIHPRFIAEMIRLGDLLDLDNGRFSDYVEKVNGELPEKSKIHKEKHRSTKHVLVTPNIIEVIADCQDEDVYRETRIWFDWLEKEIQYLTINWTEIIPSNLTGYAPKFTRKEIFLRGKEDLNKLTNLKFEISQKKAFEIIEGANIYEDKYSFIREFIQNAVDASKIQLWRDLKEEIYLNCYRSDSIVVSELMPFDIKNEIYDNYKIEVIIKDVDDDEIEVIIKDRGIGISLETLKAMGNVATSYSGNLELKKEIREMPKWLRPTGGFGIGVQSGFLINNKFKAYTKTNGNCVTEITFESGKSNGYIQVRSTDENIKRGTEFHIRMSKNEEIKYSLDGYVEEYLRKEYDPIANDNLIVYKILDTIAMNYYHSIFPIYINIDDDIKQIESPNTLEGFGNNYKSKGDYIYIMSKDLSKIEMWDKENDVCITIEMNSLSMNIPRVDVLFKGIHVKKSGIRARIFIQAEIDIYGMDTKEALKLNRNELTLNGKIQVENIFSDCVKFYVRLLREEVDKKINENNFSELNNFSGLAFITYGCLLLDDFNVSNYKCLIKKNEYNNILILEKVNGRFVNKTKSLIEIIEMYPNVSYMDLDDVKEFRDHSQKNDYEWIQNSLPENIHLLGESIIIIDNYIVDILKYFIVKKIQVIDEKRNILIYTINNKSKDIGVEVDNNAEEYFIKLLVPVKYHVQTNRVGEFKQRSYIPAIKKYKDIAVDLHSIFGLGHYRCNCEKIISPITRKDKANILQYINKEEFLYSIVNREDYKKLLKYTLKNRISKEKISEKEIDNKYRELIVEYFDIIKNCADDNRSNMI